MDLLLRLVTIYFKLAAFLNVQFYLYCKTPCDKILPFETGHISEREEGLSNGKAAECSKCTIRVQ